MSKFAPGARLILLLLIAACAPPTGSGSSNTLSGSNAVCELSSDDAAWLQSAMEAWHFATVNISEVGAVDALDSVIFDDSCVLLSSDAMTGTSSQDATWRAQRHDGTIVLPDGEEMPATVASFTQADDSHAFFVMSTPRVWRAAGVDGMGLELETLMIAVLLHEGAHISQFASYGSQIDGLVDRYALPDSFNDDSIQEQFAEDEKFADSIAREIQLLLASANAATEPEALDMARQARALMAARRATWFTGELAYLAEAEDLWLTLEGSAQWVGYRWLIDPAGQAMPVDAAMQGFGQRSRWWTQKQGLALALVVARFDADWKDEVFSRGEQTLTDLLDKVLDQAD